MSIELQEEIRLLLKAMEVHERHFQSDCVATTLASLIGALCDVGKLTPLQFQTIGVWILEGGLLKKLETDPENNQVQKIILPPVDGSEPSVAYLRMPVWHVSQVEALHLEDQVEPMKRIEGIIPPNRPENN